MFTDIIYFHKTFLGTLPDTLEEFREKVHELFPVIVDTKYLGTHKCGDINPKSSLEELEENLRSQISPTIKVHPKHDKYLTHEAFHEAGYDSYLTARVMILLSAKLEAAGTYVEESKLLEPTSDEEVFFSADEPDLPVESSLNHAVNGSRDKTEALVTVSGPQPDLIAPSVEHADTTESSKKKKKRSKRTEKKQPSRKDSKTRPETDGPPTTTRFAQPTLFSRLRQMSLDDGDDDANDEAAAESLISEPRHRIAPNTNGPDPTAFASPPARLDPRAPPFFAPGGSESWDEPQPQQPTESDRGQENSEEVREGLMPAFSSDFWRVYGNKLRVFGTVEGVFPLTRVRD